MRKQRLVELCAILSTFTLLAACKSAPADERSDGRTSADCLFFSTVYDWQPLDETNLVIWAPGRNQMYHVKLTMPLIGLKFAHTIAFIDADRDRRLCAFGRDSLSYREGSMSQRSTIFSMDRLEPQAVAALEEKYKVKLTRDSKRKEKPKVPDRETAE